MRTFGVVSALILLGIGMRPILSQDNFLPATTGPYQVGTAYRHWIDETRDEVFTAEEGDKRELLVRFWYPAEPEAGAEPFAYLPNADLLIPAIGDIFTSDLLSHPSAVDDFMDILSHAYLDAPVTDDQPSYPVLIYSHGWVGTADYNAVQAEELASHGYIVVAIAHTYNAAATVFPDGRVALFNPDVDPDDAIEIGVADQLFVLDQLTSLNAGVEDSLFAGRLDLDRLAVFGYSWGGAVATLMCMDEPRCKAVVNEDGPVPLRPLMNGLPQPAMFIASGPNGEYNYSQVYDASDGPAYALAFEKFGHGNFVDMALWPGIAAPDMLLGDTDPLAAARMLNAYLLAFFDKHLKGEHEPLLDGPSADYPDVRFESHGAQ